MVKIYSVYLKGRNDAVMVTAKGFGMRDLPAPFCDSVVEFYDETGADVAKFYTSHVQGVVG